MAHTWAAFDEIKTQVAIEDVLRRYGRFDALEQKGAQLVGHCPFHRDSKPSFKVTPERNIWHCFGCNSGGDVIDLVRFEEGMTDGKRNADRRKAALLIGEWFGIESKRPATASKRIVAAPTETQEAAVPVEEEPVREEALAIVEQRIETPVNPPLKFELKHIDADHPYLRERGLTKETVETFGLGYFGGKGTMHNRIVIPIHNEAAQLVAYAGRWPGNEGWPDGEDKYKFPSREHGFYKSRLLYNLHRAREHASEGLIVVEGFFSVFELWQKGRRNVVAAMGSHLSPEQEQLLVSTVGPKGRVLIAFDPDEAGRKGMRDAVARLSPQVFVRTIELHR